MTSKTLIHISALFLATAILSIIIFKNGYPVGYDYKNQIIAYESVSKHILEGDIYPRWLADINKGYGGTNLYFYPPFIYYSGLLIDLITVLSLPTGTILSLNSFLLLFLSGISFYIFARGLSTPNISMAASILYILLPYHSWFEIYERNATAELSSYIWIPLIFHCINKPSLLKQVKYKVTLTLSYSLLIMSHLPTAVFSSIFFLIYIILKSLSVEDTKERVRYVLASGAFFILGLGIAGIYLYPAISLLENTNSEYLWKGYYEYENWFLWFGRTCPITLTCNNLFIIGLMQITVPLIILLIFNRQKSFNIETKNYLLLAFLCFILMTPYSKFLWEILPPLHKIQFPWRMLVMSDFLFTAISLTIITNLKIIFQDKKLLLYTAMAATALPVIILNIHIANYVKSTPTPPLHKFQDSIENKMLTEEHVPKNKNLTASFKDLQLSNPAPFITVIDENAKISIISKKPRRIDFTVQAHKNFTLQIRQFYFFGWRVKRDNIDITQKVNLRDAKPFGQMEMTLPKGEYLITLVLETLPNEKIGFYLSFISILTLIGAIIISYKRNYTA